MIQLTNERLVLPNHLDRADHLWINDLAEKKVYEMDTSEGVIFSFSIPDPTGGAKGITWDGEYLYLKGWASPTIQGG